MCVCVQHLYREVYDKLSPGFKGRCTAPLLIDKQNLKPVSNESSSIVRMLGQLQLPGCTGVDLYPQHLQQQIDALNDKVGECRYTSNDFLRLPRLSPAGALCVLSCPFAASA